MALKQSSIYFLYPLTSFLEQEVYTSIKQNRFFVLKPCVGPPLLSEINIKGKHLLSCTLIEMIGDMI